MKPTKTVPGLLLSQNIKQAYNNWISCISNNYCNNKNAKSGMGRAEGQWGGSHNDHSATSCLRLHRTTKPGTCTQLSLCVHSQGPQAGTSRISLPATPPGRGSIGGNAPFQIQPDRARGRAERQSSTRALIMTQCVQPLLESSVNGGRRRRAIRD